MLCTKFQQFQTLFDVKYICQLSICQILACKVIALFIFFQAWKQAESSKSGNLISYESGRYFTILPANPRGNVGSFIHKFVCFFWMNKKRHFETIFLKTCTLISISWEKWILLFRQKIWR